MPPDELGRILTDRTGVVRRTVLGTAGGGGHEDLTDDLVTAVVDAMLRHLHVVSVSTVPDRFGELGARYERRGVALASLLGDVHLIAAAISHCWWTAARTSDVDAMFALGQSWEPAIAEIAVAVTGGYVQGLVGSARPGAARRAVAVELVSGRRPPPELVRAAQVQVGASYAVLALGPGGPPPVGDPITAVLGRALGTHDVLVLGRGERLVLLVPGPDVPAAARARTARDLFAAVAGALDVDVGGVAFTPVAEVPAGVARAVHALGLGLARGATGALLAADPLVPRLPPAPAGPRRGPVLGELGEWPELVATLQELYRQGLDHGRTAAALGIARHALVRRLQRIGRLTGLDPLAGAGRQRFTAELSPGGSPGHGA